MANRAASSYEAYLFNPELLPMASGLPNFGNTCWFNALSQVLFTLTPFNQLLREGNILPAKRFAHAYLAALGGDINKFRSMLHALPLEQHRQHCADEGLSKFIDALGIAPASNMLNMVFRTTISCSCGYKQTDNEKRHQFIVPSPTPPSDIAFTRRLYETTDVLTDYNCPQCKMPINKRSEQLVRIENVLVFVFNQFANKQLYYFPEKIVLPGITPGSNHVFTIVAQIEHSGTAHGGHYWARVLRKNGIFLINDSMVSPSRFQPTPETYMVVYCKTHHGN